LTKRGLALGGIALVLYAFANQTQVGWLYVFSAAALALWLSSWPLPSRMLGRLRLARRVNGSAVGTDVELHAGDSVDVEMDVTNQGWLPALQVAGIEACPLAPAPERRRPFFLPYIGSGRTEMLAYTTTCARRGWFSFGPAPLATQAPFGLWAARRAALVGGPEGVLVFPEYRALDRLDFFDQQPALESTLARAGQGGEFLGVREYRPGDPRRFVHWRSTARAGRLVVKEFAQEQQPALTLALDLRAAGRVGGDDDNPLELGIKAAASLARHALQRGIPVRLAANSHRWPAPRGALGWWPLMAYLARVEAEGEEPLAPALRQVSGASFVAAILPVPDSDVVAPLLAWQRAGLAVLAVVIDPAVFAPAEPWLGKAARRVAGELAAGGVAVRLLGAEPDWERVLVEGEGK
jgi:uncharacterized protein (DUF58 family)